MLSTSFGYQCATKCGSEVIIFRKNAFGVCLRRRVNFKRGLNVNKKVLGLFNDRIVYDGDEIPKIQNSEPAKRNKIGSYYDNDLDIVKIKDISTSIEKLGSDQLLDSFLKHLDLSEQELSAIVMNLSKRGQRRKALGLYKCYKLQNAGFSPNRYLSATLMCLYSRLQNEESNIRKLFEEMRSQGTIPTIVGFNCVLAIEARLGNLEKALYLLNIMKNLGVYPDVATYTSLISACSHQKQYQKALKFFKQMQKEGIQPNIKTYTALMCALRRGGRWRDVPHYFRQMLAAGLKPDVQAYNNLISSYADGEDCTNAHRYFNSMLQSSIQPNVYSYNTLMTAYQKCAQFDSALQVFDDLTRRADIKPDTVSFNIAIYIYGSIGLLEEAVTLYKQMCEDGPAPDVTTLSSLTAICDKEGQWQLGSEIFEECMKNGTKPNQICYNSLLSMLGQGGQWEGALKKYEEMKSLNIAPDVITFSTLISSLVRCGESERALDVYSEMKEKKIKPNGYVYYALLVALEPKNEWKRALELLSEIKLEESGEDSDDISLALIVKRFKEFWPHLVKLIPQPILDVALVTIESGKATRKWVDRL